MRARSIRSGSVCPAARGRARRAARRLAHAGAVVLALASVPLARADGLEGAVGITSDKVYRGVSLSNGEPSAMLDLLYRTDTGWSAGLGLATARLLDGTRFYEVAASVGRGWQIDNDWTTQLSYVRYEYPGTSLRRVLDYGQFYAAAGWRGRLYGSVAWSPDTPAVDATGGRRTGNMFVYEITLRQPVAGRLAFEAGLGHVDRRVSDDAADYGSVGLAWGHEATSVYLGWTTTNAGDRGIAPPQLAGSRWLVSLYCQF